MRLSADGKTILSVTRLANDVTELELSPNDEITVACGTEGLHRLSANGSRLMWSWQPAEADAYLHRLDVSHDGSDPSRHGFCAVLEPENPSQRFGKAGKGRIYLISPTGQLLTSFRGAAEHTLDVAIHAESQSIYGIGYANRFTWTDDLANARTPVDIPWLISWPWTFTGNGGPPENWRAYDWSAQEWLRDAEGNFLAERDSSGNPLPWLGPDGDPITDQNDEPVTDAEGKAIPRRIPNPRWINGPFSPNKIFRLADGRIFPRDETNSMADTRGNRVAIGEDGFLYTGFEFDGGNSPLRFQPFELGTYQFTDPTDPNSGVAEVAPSRAPFNGGNDLYDSTFNTSTVPKVWVNRCNPNSGEVLAGTVFTCRLTSTRDNTTRLRYGDITADASGRVYLCGDSASGLPILFNRGQIDNGTLVADNPFGPSSYAGGAWSLVLSADFSQRLYCTRLITPLAGPARTRSIAARWLGDQALIAWGGEGHPAAPLHLVDPVQSVAEDAPTQGHFAVLGGQNGGRPLGESVQLNWEVNDEIRTGIPLRNETMEASDLLDLDNDGDADDRIFSYPFDPALPLSPATPDYEGPVFKGGLEVRAFDHTGFTPKATLNPQGRLDFISQPNRGSTATVTGAIYFEKDQLSLQTDEPLTFNTQSFLFYSDSNAQGPVHWLVRDGEQFYVSEESFDRTKILSFQTDISDGRWALYFPENSLAPTFDNVVERNFTDITAIGFVIAQTTPSGARFFQRWSRLTARFAQGVPVNLPPQANFSRSLARAGFGEAVALRSAATDDTGLVSWLWDFGDGTTASGPEVEHAWQAPGRYRIELQVRDQQNAPATFSRPIEITSARSQVAPSRVVATWGGNQTTHQTQRLFEAPAPVATDADKDGEIDDRAERAPLSTALQSTFGKVTLRSAYQAEYLDSTSTATRFRPETTNGTTTNGDPADRFNLRFQPPGPARLSWLLFIEKDQFLNGGNERKVTLDEQSVLRLVDVTRDDNLGQKRWVLREDDTFYVSEELADDLEVGFRPPSSADHGNWATFEATDNLRVASLGGFEPRLFQNITAVGLWMQTETFTANTRHWFNFSHFEFLASVDPDLSFEAYQLASRSQAAIDLAPVDRDLLFPYLTGSTALNPLAINAENLTFPVNPTAQEYQLLLQTSPDLNDWATVPAQSLQIFPTFKRLSLPGDTNRFFRLRAVPSPENPDR